MPKHELKYPSDINLKKIFRVRDKTLPEVDKARFHEELFGVSSIEELATTYLLQATYGLSFECAVLAMRKTHTAVVLENHFNLIPYYEDLQTGKVSSKQTANSALIGYRLKPIDAEFVWENYRSEATA